LENGARPFKPGEIGTAQRFPVEQIYNSLHSLGSVPLSSLGSLGGASGIAPAGTAADWMTPADKLTIKLIKAEAKGKAKPKTKKMTGSEDPLGELPSLENLNRCLCACYGVRHILCTLGFRWAGNIGPSDRVVLWQ
jgi:hypothetical protein